MSRFHFCKLTLLVITCILGLTSRSSFSQEAPTSVDLEVADDPVGSSSLLANQLIVYGRENKSPEALVTAAMILAKLPSVDANEKGEFEKKPSASQGVEIESILKEALAMRDGDATVKELVERTRDSLKEKSRSLWDPSSVDAIKRYQVKLAARTKKSFSTVTKKKGEKVTASIPISGTVAITNQAGTVIASGNGSATINVSAAGNYTVWVQAGSVALATTLSVK